MTEAQSRIFLLLFFAAVVFYGAGCARDAYCTLDEPDVAATTAAVHYGEVPEDLRSYVRIERYSTTGRIGYCGGTVVGEHTVMTAAHCLDENEVAVVALRDGEWLGQSSSWLIHEDWDQGKGIVNSKKNEADLALIWFDEPLGVEPATVGEIPNGCYPGLRLLGEGRDENGEYLNLRTRVVYEAWHNARTIFATEGTDFGDSGSGVYVRTPEGETVLGVVSFSRRMGDADRGRGTKGFTNMVTYGKWVQDRTF